MIRNYLDILAETIRNNWNHPALTDFYLTDDGKAQDTSRGNHYTYGEMYEEIVRVADLLTNLGLQKGDHIAICGANSAHWVIAYLAIAKMQGVSVTVMHSLQSDEMASLIDFSDAKALFADKDIWEELQDKSLLQVKSVIGLEKFEVLKGKQIKNQKSQITNQDCQFPYLEPNNLAMICFTSGSSGNPKGVMWSYDGISNLICGSLIKTDYIETVIRTNRPFLAIMPFAHMFGLIDNVLSHLTYGARVVVVRETLSVETIAFAIRFNNPYGLAIVPMLIKELITKMVNQQKENLLSSLMYILTTGANMTEELEETLIKKRILYFVGYGLSEKPYITLNNAQCYKKSSSGRVIDQSKLHIAPSGEILVKGENVMLGYYKDPEATAAKIDKDGWLHTGDKGHLDEDGYLYVEGRLEQDIIVLPNGENIRPDNIEALINALPEVKESIVIARDGKLIAIVVPSLIENRESKIEVADLCRNILHHVNPLLPLYSQLDKVELSDTPLARTEKQTLKRYLYH